MWGEPNRFCEKVLSTQRYEKSEAEVNPFKHSLKLISRPLTVLQNGW